MAKRILVCERKSLARIAYKGTLEMQGYDIVGETTCGAEAVRLYEALKPDLVLMSAILAEPEGNGLLVIQKILALDPNAIIVAYANPCICSRAACEQAGVKGFFLYPARPDEMLATVQSLIG